ncbi:hypothetical protein WMY93_010377 [Mugilogobius chulae]|uniref:Uncharacterized protein n=1 Tax=Mugilogobius chulae TaxID=88201 RepID=A0AAW0PDG4_9GOBI
MPQDKDATKVSPGDAKKQQIPGEVIQDTVSKQIDALFQDCDFICKISKLLVDSLIEPIKRAITNSITESVKESLKYELQNTVDGLENLQRKYDDVEDILDEQEQYSRRNCLVVFGVPENDRENTDEVILGIIGKKLKLEIQPGEIDRSHRLGPKSNNKKEKPRGIIVKFAHYNIRNKVYRAKKELKGSAMYILESLTAKRVKLLEDLRKKFKDKLAASWTQDGRIYLLTNSNQRHVLSKLSAAKNLRIH